MHLVFLQFVLASEILELMDNQSTEQLPTQPPVQQTPEKTTHHSSHISKRLLIGGIVSVLLLGSIGVLLLKEQQRTQQAAIENQQLQFAENQEVTIKGTVIENSTKDLELDAPAYFILKTEKGTIEITYHPGDAPCPNQQAQEAGLHLEKGDEVEVFGKFSQKQISTCSNRAYFIHTNNAPNQITNPTANWKTYKSKFNWSIQYPSNWTYDIPNPIQNEQYEYIHFQGPQECRELKVRCAGMTISVKRLSKILETAKEYWLTENKNTARVITEKNISINGAQGYEVSYAEIKDIVGGKEILLDPIYKTIIVVHKQDVFQFTFNENNFQTNGSWSVLVKDWTLNTLFNQILSTFKFTDQETNTDNKGLVTITYRGGLCPSSVVCSSTYTITQDGNLLNAGEKIKNIASNDFLELKNLIKKTNFAQIKTKPFTGTCPTAFDGKEATYTFYTESGTETIASCKVTIDTNSPLFQKIATILQ